MTTFAPDITYPRFSVPFRLSKTFDSTDVAISNFFSPCHCPFMLLEASSIKSILVFSIISVSCCANVETEKREAIKIKAIFKKTLVNMVLSFNSHPVFLPTEQVLLPSVHRLELLRAICGYPS